MKEEKSQEKTLAEELFNQKPQKKRASDPRRKGARAEIDVGKHLLIWTGYEFNRVPRSGGLRWTDASRITGDLITAAENYYPFVNEVKSYKALKMTAELRPDAFVFNFWRQVVDDCSRVGKKLPLLFCREDDMPTVKIPGTKKTLLDFVLFVQPCVYDLIVSMGCSLIYSGVSNDGYTIYGFQLSEVIQKVSFSEFIEKIEVINSQIFG